ncbi:Rieske 2Fe-2S domain-containing protein [Acinetobacter puyangensis]
MMSVQWLPILPSELLQNAEVLKVLINGKEVVVWRSVSGHVQIWENRCPHRSVRLSLGHVDGENLVCAYHGWEFAAQDGSCQKIPAQPEQRAPKSVCSKAYPVSENNGMIWFGGFDLELRPEPLAQQILSLKIIPVHYAGSVLIHCTMDEVTEFLQHLHFRQTSPCGFLGDDDFADVQLFLTPTDAEKTTLHALQPQAETVQRSLDSLFQIRQQIEEHQYAVL